VNHYPRCEGKKRFLIKIIDRPKEAMNSNLSSYLLVAWCDLSQEYNFHSAATIPLPPMLPSPIKVTQEMISLFLCGQVEMLKCRNQSTETKIRK